MATAVSQLVQDLKSGNTAATQSALVAVQQQGAGQAHHHHHHGSGESRQSPASRTRPLHCSASNFRRAIYRVPNRLIPRCSRTSSSSRSTILPPPPANHPAHRAPASAFPLGRLAEHSTVRHSESRSLFERGSELFSIARSFWHSGSSRCSCFSTPGLKTGHCVV